MIVMIMACQNTKEKEDVMTFGEDLEFLKKHTETVLLTDTTGQAQIIASPSM